MHDQINGCHIHKEKKVEEGTHTATTRKENYDRQ